MWCADVEANVRGINAPRRRQQLFQRLNDLATNILEVSAFLLCSEIGDYRMG
jgi:hypothetical protein